MEKKSGVSITLTDNSIVSGGTQELKAVIPMLTSKGELGLNKVTAQNFKEVLGYDIDKNPNYYGLSEILNSISYAYVWRLNQDASSANMYIDKDGEIAYMERITSEKEFPSDAKLTVTKKSVGDDKINAVRFTPKVQTKPITNKVDNDTWSFEIDNVSKSEEDFKISVDGEVINFFGGAKIYDSSNVGLIGVFRKTSENNYEVYRCANGVVDIKKENDTFKNSIGTATYNDGKLTVTTNKPFNTNSTWIAHYVGADYIDWEMSFGDYNDGEVSNVKDVSFSLDTESDEFIDNVDFGEVIVKNNNGITSSNNNIRNWCILGNGSNGKSADELSVVDVDMTPLNTVKANFLFFNGFNENVPIINAICEKAISRKIHCFVDMPAFATYDECEAWRNKIYASSYVAIGAKADRVNYKDGYIYVYPSVKYCAIYANMLRNTGTLNYPPAGFTYGVVSVSDPIETDFDYYGNELKTNRINYILTDDRGSCIWEQRTTNAINSDMSYIAPVFIIDALCDELVAYERNYNFRYPSGAQLIVNETGLQEILDNFKDNGFLYYVNLKMPTLDEAKSSREFNIEIEVKVTKDSENININLVLSN